MWKSLIGGFRNLKVGQKLLLLSILIGLPDAAMLCFYVTSINAQIDVARLERKGNEYQQTLESLLRLVPMHEMLVARVREGDISAQVELARNEAAVDRLFLGFADAHARISSDVEFTPEAFARRKRGEVRPAKLKEEWHGLKLGGGEAGAPDSRSEHRQLVDDVLAMISYVNEACDLTIDPKLETSFLIDASALALPQSQQRLGNLLVQSEKMLRKPTLTEEDRQYFAIHAALLQESDLNRVRDSLKAALAEDANFYGVSPSLQARVPPALERYADVTAAFIELTRRAASPAQPPVTLADYLGAGENAWNASFELSAIAQTELDVLLRTRIAAQRRSRDVSLAVAFAGFLLAIGMGNFLTRSINQPLRRQAAELLAANEILHTEITERARIEADLRQSEASLAEAQRVAHLGSWTFELGADGAPEQESLRWTDETYRIFGTDSSDPSPPWRILERGLRPDESPAVFAAFEEAVRTRKPFTLEHHLVLPDGRERSVHAEARVVADQNPGGSLRIVGTVHDITERQAAEDIRRAKEGAEKANAAKSEFLSRMSHELRTPLNAILGFGQVLEMSSVAEEDRDCVSFILKAGRHLLGLVDEILDLTRIEAGHLHMATDPVSVNDVIEDSLGLVERLAAARRIRCRFAPADSHSLVFADEQRLRQVMLNLLSNAIKYNVEGGRIVVSTEQRPEGNLRIKVSDTGRGIETADLDQLFVPFSRLGYDFGEVEGTGLGLVVSRRLVEAMGGTMGVESEPGEGSTFWIDLHLVRDPGSARAGAAPEPSVAPLRQPSNEPRNATTSLLYIEDTKSNFQLVEMLMARQRPDWKLLSARDGETGLEEARRCRPNVLLLDLQLPGISGDEVLAKVRGEPALREMPVIVLTADATALTRERLLRVGADDYVVKPLNALDLLTKIDALLTSSEDRRGASRGRKLRGDEPGWATWP